MKQITFELEQFHSTASIVLPEGWKVGEATHGRLSVCHQFHPHDDEAIAIIISSRGHELSEDMAEKFKHVLAAPPHTLHDLERQRISEVLANQSVRARFTLTSVRTEPWQGKTVLITEGTYAYNGDRAFTLFVDAHDDGAWVEEFQYSAPADTFNQHFNDAVAAFKELTWQARSVT